MKKLFYLICLFLLSNFEIHAQVIIEDVPLIGQWRSRWCWTASIKMVLEHYNISKTQCEICKNKFPTLCTETDILDTCYCKPTDTGNCNKTLQILCNETVCGNVKEILNSYDVAADEVLTLTPTQIKEQINQNMPMVLYLSRQGDRVDDDSYDHVVVVNGYLDLGEDNFFLYIKDPWIPCEGCEYLIKYNNDSIISFYSWTYNIKPYPTPVPSPDKPIFSGLCPNQPKVISFDKNPIRVVDSFAKFIDMCSPKNVCLECNGNKLSNEVPFWNGYKEISYLKMLDKKQYKNPYYPNKKIVVQYPSIKNFQFILNKSKYNKTLKIKSTNQYDNTTYWAIESIDNCGFLSTVCQQHTDYNCQTIDVLLNNLTKTIGTKATPYRIVTYPTFNYKFECFTDKGVGYCMTDKFIPDLSIQGQFLKPFVAVKQSILFEALHTKTVAYDASLKLKYPNGGGYSH